MRITSTMLTTLGAAMGLLAACGSPGTGPSTHNQTPSDEQTEPAPADDARDPFACGAACDTPEPTCSDDMMIDSENCGACGVACGEQRCGDGICNAHAWSSQLAGTVFTSAEAVAIAPDGDAVIVGSFAGRIDILGSYYESHTVAAYVAKLHADGEVAWFLPLVSDGGAKALAVDIDGNGAIAVAGAFTGAMKLGTAATPGLVAVAHEDAFVVGLTKDGGIDWATSFGDALAANGNVASAESQRASEVAFMSDGNLVVGGAFSGSVAIGSRQFFAEGDAEMYLARIDQHDVRWAFGYTAPGEQALEALAVNAKDAIVIVGSYTDELDLGSEPVPALDDRDAFAARIAEDGTLEWRTAWRGPGAQTARAVAIDPVTDTVFVAGGYETQLDLVNGEIETLPGNGADIFLVALYGDGAVHSVQSFGGARDQIVAGIDITGAGDIWLAGHFAGALDFGAGAMDAGDSTDVFVARLSYPANWSQRLGGDADERALAIAATAEGQAIVVGNHSGALDLGGGNLPIGGGPDETNGVSASFVAGFEAAAAP